MKTLRLKETQSPYTLTIDEAILVDGPVRVLQGEQTIGVLVPPDEYEAFRTWKESQQRQARVQQTHEAFEREVAAFERMLPELLQKYRDRVVAVHNGQVDWAYFSDLDLGRRNSRHLVGLFCCKSSHIESCEVRSFVKSNSVTSLTRSDDMDWCVSETFCQFRFS